MRKLLRFLSNGLAEKGRTLFILSSIVFYCGFVNTQNVYAQTTFTFTNGNANGNWNEAGNWSPAGGSSTSTWPGENSGQNDQVLIPTGSGFTVTLNVNVTNNSITLVTVNGDATLDINTDSLTTTGSSANVTGTGTITISTGTLTVGGILDVSTLTASGTAAIDLSGNWSIPALGFTPSTSVVTLTGGAAKITTATTFTKLIVNKTTQSTVDTMYANVNVTDTLRISTGVLATGTFTLNGTGGSDRITISNGATLKLQGTNSFPTTFSLINLDAGSIVDYAGGTQVIDVSVTYENLKVSGSGYAGNKTLSGATLNLNGNLTLSDTLNIAGNTITAAGGSNVLTLNTSSNLQLSGNNFPTTFESSTVTGGKVEFNGAAQNIPSRTFYDLVLSGSGVKTALGADTVLGSVTIGNAVVFNAGAFTHLVGGNWTANYSGILFSTGTINFNGSAHTIQDTSTFNNVIFSGGGSVSLQGANTRNDTITGDFTISNGTSVSVPSTLNIVVFGDWDASGGTFSPLATSTATFANNSSDQNISASNFGNLSFANGAFNTKFATGAWIVAGGVNIQGGSQVDGGSFTHNVAGAWTCNGTFFENTSTINLNGAGAQSLSGGTLNFYNLSTSTGGTKTQNAAITILTNLTIGTGTVYQITSGAITAAGASLITNGTGAMTINTSAFPTFASYSFATTSTVTYGAASTTVQGGLSINYPNLTLTTGAKSLNGTVVVNGNLVISANTSLDLQTFDISVAGAVTVGTAGGAVSSISSSGGGSMTLNAADANQVLTVNAGVGGGNTFTVNNLTITLDGPTAARTKTITANNTGNLVNVNGNFNATNTGGDATNTLTIALGTSVINNTDGADQFTLGANTLLTTTGATSFNTGITSFGTQSLSATSTVWYSVNGAQSIAATDGGVPITYGNLTLSGGNNKTALDSLVIAGNFTRTAGVYIDAGFPTHVRGNWTMGATAGVFTSTGTVIFDGSSAQTIGTSNFLNVKFANTGTATFSGNMVVTGNFTVSSGATVDANTRNITMSGGSWINPEGGTFTQGTVLSAGTTTFSGISLPTGTSITSSSTSQFGNLTLSTDTTITLNSNINVARNFTFTADSASLDATGDSITVGLNWTRGARTTFVYTGSTVVFNSSYAQLVSVDSTVNKGNYFNNAVFAGVGTKTADNSRVGGTQAAPIIFEGDVTIGSGATFAGGNATDSVKGDWTNDGSFTSTGTIVFCGAGQTVQISTTSTFYNVVFGAGEAGKQVLQGNITITNNLTIGDFDTLDVSTNNYAISLGGNWVNNSGTNAGVFLKRYGTVTFVNNTATSINTGDRGNNTDTKNFWNLVINKSGGTATVTTGTRLDVDSNFTLALGTLAINTDTINIGGSFINSTPSTITQTGISRWTFDDLVAADTDSIRAGVNISGVIIINSPATYVLSGSLSSTYANGAGPGISLTNCYFDLNGQTLTVSDSIHINSGATLDVDSAGKIQLGASGAANNALINQGGTLKVVGVAGSPATITRAGALNYTITQTSGTFHAKYYQIQYTQTTGVLLSGGSVDPVNNFSNGTFSNGSGTVYLDFTDIAFVTTDSIKNVIFSAGPTYNVHRTAASDTIVFQDASGARSGQAYEQDPAGVNAGASSLIEWTYPSGIFWTNLGTPTNSWKTAANWSANKVPGTGDNVVIDHRNIAGAITVNIDTTANCGDLTLDSAGSGGTATVLDLNTGNRLHVEGSIIIGDFTTLRQTSSSDTLYVSTNWTNAGTHVSGNAAVVLDDPIGGTHTITSGVGAKGSFYRLIIRSPNTTYQLADSLRIRDSLSIESGTLDVTTSNYTIVDSGGWSNAGTFNPRAGNVVFSRQGSSTQTISGGPFWGLTFAANGGGGTATKKLNSNLDVNSSVTINSNTFFDGGTNTIYVGSGISANTNVWTNNATLTAFSQTGTGTVYVDNAAFQATFATGTSGTTFNNLILSAAGTKLFSVADSVIGDFTIASGCGQVNMGAFQLLVRAGNTSTFTIAGATTLSLTGFNNFPGASPNVFNTVNLNSSSTVSYGLAGAQQVAGVTYGNLTLTGGGGSKSATGNIIVAGTVAVTTAGTDFNMNGFDLTVTGAAGNTNDINLAASTTFTPGTGTVTHNGDAWAIDAQITTFNNLILGGSGVKTMNASLGINGDLTVGSGVTLTMGAFQVTGTGSKVFTMSGTAALNTTIAAPDSAFPKSFGTNTLSSTSTVTLNGANQNIRSSNVTYGNLTLSTAASSKSANGPLSIAGNVTTGANVTLVDNGYTLNVGGNWTQAGLFTTTGTVRFNGTAAQLASNTNGAVGQVYVVFNNLVCAGSNTKTLGDANDSIRITGNFSIDSGSTATTTRPWLFSGNWTNLGTFTATAQTITFTGNAQNINPGANSSFFNNVSFTTGGPKTFMTNGADINGTFGITGVTVDMGTLSHNIAGTVTNTGGTWTTSNARLTFDGAGQTITSPTTLTAKSIVLAGTGTKTMGQDWSIDSLTIGSVNTLTSTASNYDITLTGSWINNGTFTANSDTVFFESNNTSPQTITNAAGNLYVVMFNRTQTSARTYSLQSGTMTIGNNMTIGTGATLDLNGKILISGTNAIATTNRVYGSLDVDAGSQLRFNNTTSPGCSLIVHPSGTFVVAGTNGNAANVNRSAGAFRTAILDSGTIKTKYYVFDQLSDSGLIVLSSATVDNDSNFSDGTWNNINNVSGARYLRLDANATGIDTIKSVTFNVGTAPVAGVENVRRSSGGTGTFNFGGTIDGALAGLQASPTANLYEFDPGSQLNWPVLTTANWTGTTDRDWNEPTNWDIGTVPTSTIDVSIPDVSGTTGNAPKITSADASCKTLTITDGNLTLENSRDLTVLGDVNIGSTGAGVLVVNSNGSEITVGGSWTRGASGVFTNGNGKVTFNGSAGTKTITPLTSAFSSLVFDGNATFSLVGATFTVNDTLRISTGDVKMTTNNQNLNLGGDFNLQSGGSFDDTTTTGRVVLTGSNQQVWGGYFYRLRASGSGIKAVNGYMRVTDSLAVTSSTLRATPGSTIEVNGNMLISSGGTFNDSTSGTHTFAGRWTSSGSYTGTGTVTLDGAAQSIDSATFNNLILSGSGTKTLFGNVITTGNLQIKTAITLDMGAGNGFSITGSGTNTLIMDATSTLTIRGPNNFPTSFESQTIDATSSTNYIGTSPQTVAGATYGNLGLTTNSTTRTLSGDITVLGNLNLATGTLDVSASNYSIYVGGNWTNNGTFVPRSGEVTFNGGGAQTLNTGGNGAGKAFYKFTVSKSAGTATLGAALDVDKHLTISLGTFANGGLDVAIGGDLLVLGTYTVTGGATNTTFDGVGAISITSNNAQFQHVTFNQSGSTFTLQDNLTVLQNFTLMAGTFEGNGKTVTFGTTVADVMSITGVYNIGPGGILAIGNASSVTINAAGNMRVCGSPSSVATVTRNATGGTYAFQVNGTIHAINHLFEWMNTSGIQINSAGTIDADSNFSSGTFTNGAAGGTMLKIENTQTIDSIANISFPQNPGGGAFNISKTTSVSGTIKVSPFSGPFAGTSYENDPNGLINWPQPVSLTWNGSSSSDWFTAANWTPSTGAPIIPTSANDVTIASATNQPIITAPGAVCGALTINTSTTLTLTTASAGDLDLSIGGNLTLNGTLTISSTTDSLEAGGDWTKAGGGTFNNGNATIVLNAASGTKIINNGTAPFYNLTTIGSATYRLGAATTVSNNVKLVSGSLDVSASNFGLTVGGNWTNTGGTFIPQAGIVTFNASGAVTKTISAGSSSFSGLTFNGGSSTVFQLVTNNLTTTGSTSILTGTLDLNGLIFNHGDGVASDAIAIAGILNVNANASLKMSASSILTVNSGGKVNIVGNSETNVATVTRQSAGTYSFGVNSGGSMGAKYYSFEYMDANGIQLAVGSTVDSVNDFSDGTFSNGTAGGTFWSMLAEYDNSYGAGVGHLLDSVTFNNGPTYNVTRNDGSLLDTVKFVDPSGALGTLTYENDILPPAADGLIRWYSTATTNTWTGSVNTNWTRAENWSESTVPTSSQDVTIPTGLTFYPVLDSAVGTDSNGVCKSITIQTGASLTIQNNRNLTVSNSLSNAGTLTVTNGSVDTITVGNNWSNTGTFNAGNGSTVILTAASGTKTISFGASSFNSLNINGGATFQPSAAITMTGNFTITAGTFDVTASNYQVNVAGNWSNSGTFTSRSGLVIFNGTGAQTITTGGTGAGKTFYNFRINKASGTASLSGNLGITNDITLSAGTFSNGTNAVNVGGIWSNTAATFTAGSGIVTLDGTGTKTMTTNSQAFGPLVINKSGGGQITMNSSLTVNGNLTILAGTLFANNRTIAFGGAASDTVGITGTLNLDAGSILQMRDQTWTTVNSGGTLRAVGTSAVAVATITRRTSGNYSINVNGSLAAKFATIEYTFGNGVTIGSTGSVDATNNLSNVTFQNGTGTSYLRIQNAGTITPSGTRFDSASANRATNNVVYTGSGNISFSNYKGTMAGVNYESDNGSGALGNVNWAFTETQAVANATTALFGNDVVIKTASTNLGSTTVVLVGDTLHVYKNPPTDSTSSTSQTVARYYTITPTSGGSSDTLRLYYGQAELGVQSEAGLFMWRRRDGQWARMDTMTVESAVTITKDSYNNYVQANNYPFVAGKKDTLVLSSATNDQSLPVELTSFTGFAEEKQIVLSWRTESEVSNAYWIIERKEVTEDLSKALGYQSILTTEGQGTKSSATDYSQVDEAIETGKTYMYRLADVSMNGIVSYHKEIKVTAALPDKFALKQNYPNPFNPSTTLRYDLPMAAKVTIKIYNILGQEVYTLVDNKVMGPGYHKAVWNSINKNNSKVASGIYIYRISANSLNTKDRFTQSRKMILIK